ncbi:MAG: CoB--CoM heterodisulfide reductase iron-sulfur subunit B family protein [Bacteroidota bacterium]|nr:CoB--CoM heterodisulfide reductase iron-sulfur subunit B family protein [Bacteroidota bacterium]
MKIPYYPGCTLKSAAKHFEKSAIESAKKIGVEFVELPRWNCCGVVASLADDDLMHHLAPIRNMVRVLEMNRDGLVEDEKRLLMLCSMCYNTLSRSNKRVSENSEDLDAINDFMYKEEIDYDGSVETVHFLEIIKEIGFDKVKKAVKKSLKNLKVAPYYGCMLLRPKEVGIDDPETPTIFENLISSLTAEPIKWNNSRRCCGSFLTVDNADVVIELGSDILEDAKNSGADIIITSCPLCAFNLDNRQKNIKEKYPDFKEIPVVYFTQLMALAFGLSEEVMGFDGNFIDPRKLLKSKKLIK